MTYMPWDVQKIGPRGKIIQILWANDCLVALADDGSLFRQYMENPQWHKIETPDTEYYSVNGGKI